MEHDLESVYITLDSGIANGGQGGTLPPLTAKNLPKKLGKEGENQEKSWKKRKNQEEGAKIWKVLSLCPSWQIGLATLLTLGTIVEVSEFTMLLCPNFEDECQE